MEQKAIMKHKICYCFTWTFVHFQSNGFLGHNSEADEWKDFFLSHINCITFTIGETRFKTLMIGSRLKYHNYMRKYIIFPPVLLADTNTGESFLKLSNIEIRMA